MANKTALAVLAVIVLVSMGVGILIGMQLGASGGSVAGPAQGPGQGSGGGGGGGGGETATPIPTSGPQTDQTTTRPAEERTTVAARRFSRTEIEREVQQLINRERRSEGLQRMETEGNTVETLTQMARRHSHAMADAGRVDHRVNGTNSADRYRANGLYETCQFEATDGAYVIRADVPESNALEVLGQTVAGRPYEVYGEPAFNSNESEVARALVEQMFTTPAFRDRLLYGNADFIGVGVEITDDGTVYATGNVC